MVSNSDHSSQKNEGWFWNDLESSLVGQDQIPAVDFCWCLEFFCLELHGNLVEKNGKQINTQLRVMLCWQRSLVEHDWIVQVKKRKNDPCPAHKHECIISWYQFFWFSGWWFGTCFYFPISWVSNHPNWRTHIFQRGGEKPPTSFSWFTLCWLNALRGLILGLKMIPICRRCIRIRIYSDHHSVSEPWQ